jgi:hypothetical protein
VVLACCELVVSRLGSVVDIDETCRRSRLLEGHSNDERHWLTVVTNLGAAQRRLRARVWPRIGRVGAALCRRVAVSHHQTHAGRPLGTRGIDSGDAAAADRCPDDEPIEWLAHVPVLVGVGGLPGDFQRAVDAVE